MRVLYLVALIALAGCSSRVDFKGMENAEKHFNKEQSTKLCAFMNLKTMFPNSPSHELAEAARRGDIKIISQLVAGGADVNRPGTRNCSILFWAMGNGKGFEKLLQLGANPNALFDDGGTVIHWAARSRNPNLLELSLKYGGNPNLTAGLFQAAPIFETISVYGEMGEIPMTMEVLIKAGADVNVQNSSGNTPMLVAAGIGRFDIVDALLNFGADPSLENVHGVSLVDRVREQKRAFKPGSLQEKWLRIVAGKLGELPSNK